MSQTRTGVRSERQSRPQKNGHAATGLLTVIMPVHNERATLRAVLDRVLASPVEKEVLLVDDASTDGTTDLIRTEIDGKYPGVRVQYLAQNVGKGAAIRAAIPHARGDFVLIQDGDLEYDPADYPAMVRPMREEDAPIVYGSRFMRSRPRMRLPNRIVNWLLARMVRWLYGARLTDEATCYKAFRREVLQSLPLTCRRFEFCPEVTAKALRRGYRIREVPIHYEPRTHAEGKKIRWTDGVVAIWTLLRYRFWK